MKRSEAQLITARAFYLDARDALRETLRKRQESQEAYRNSREVYLYHRACTRALERVFKRFEKGLQE